MEKEVVKEVVIEEIVRSMDDDLCQEMLALIIDIKEARAAGNPVDWYSIETELEQIFSACQRTA